MHILFRTLAALLLLSALVPSAGMAGDYASREIIGFTADGGRFAFEEYGQQDGSGFPFSNIYVIDTRTDNWTGGSPFRIVIEDEEKTVSEARAASRAMAGNALSAFTEPGLIAATNQPQEFPDDPHRIVASPYDYAAGSPERLEFRIETIPMTGPDYCSEFGPLMGFRLVQVSTEAGKPARLLHEDKSLPASRACALDYRFGDVVIYRPDDFTAVMAILVQIVQVGFEGPDIRFLAVTAPLEP